jgi:hypothetical protein
MEKVRGVVNARAFSNEFLYFPGSLTLLPSVPVGTGAPRTALLEAMLCPQLELGLSWRVGYHYLEWNDSTQES